MPTPISPSTGPTQWLFQEPPAESKVPGSCRPPGTANSPLRTLSRYQLARYLDSCSEMLSLLDKLDTLHVQRFDDQVALAAVDGIEDLTTGLSRKTWQKIAVLEGGTAGSD